MKYSIFLDHPLKSVHICVQVLLTSFSESESDSEVDRYSFDLGISYKETNIQ